MRRTVRRVLTDSPVRPISLPHRSSGIARPIWLLLGLASVQICLSACAPGPPSGVQVMRRDSAGVIIVENHGVPALNGGGWTVDSTPALSIGSVEGDDAYQFFGVAGVHRLADGRIGVVSAGRREVRFFGADGAYLSTFGQRGGGPEEFENPVLVGAVSDTLVVVDRAHHRLTYVHPDVGFVRLVRVSDEVGGFLNPSGLFSNGQSVFGGAFDMSRFGELHLGMNRGHTFYRSCNPDGSFATDFGDKAGAEFFVKELGESGQNTRAALIPFGKVPIATVSHTHLFFSDQEGWEIEVYASSGDLVRLIRIQWDPIPVTKEDGARYIETMVTQVEGPEQKAQIRKSLGDLPLPESFPPFSEFEADTEGFLWVKDFQRPGAKNREWSIIDPEGALVARVTLPEHFNPMEIGADYILGVGRDEMDVEYIRMYPLTRPAGE